MSVVVYMNHKMVKKAFQLGLVLLGTSVVAGCPSQTVSNLMASGGASQEAIAQETVAQENPENVIASNSVAFEVCAEVEDWQRPNDTEQVKHLRKDARYSNANDSESIKSASAQFWDHQIVSFTTYGLSARLEPENLSGVWTATEKMSGCYEPEKAMAINEGDRAETWLLNHRVSDVQWAGDRYVMTVEPATTGLQVVQFDRAEKLASLPLEVVTQSGNAVEVVSGDWQ